MIIIFQSECKSILDVKFKYFIHDNISNLQSSVLFKKYDKSLLFTALSYREDKKMRDRGRDVGERNVCTQR